MLRATTLAAAVLMTATLSFAADKAGSLDSKDAKFLKQAAIGAMAEVETGKLAEQNAASPEVKQFGQRMVTDHGKELTELQALAQSKGVDLPTEPDKKHKKMHDKLAKMQGDEFDKAYSKDELEDHRKDVKQFQKEADKATDPDVKAFAAKQVPVLQEHLSMAEKLPANAGASSDDSSSSSSGTNGRLHRGDPHIGHGSARQEQ
jgi:putative membrane protein